MIPLAALAAALLLQPSVRPVETTAWPQWGGPTRDFRAPAPAREITDGWGEGGPPVLWRRPLGAGYSALVARDGVLYTMVSQKVFEGNAEKIAGRGEAGSPGEVIVALDAATGATRWRHRYAIDLHHAYARDFHRGPASTPAVVTGRVVAGRVVALGFTGRLHGLDAKSGAVRWAYDLVADFGADRPRFGHAASPLIDGEQVIIPVGGAAGVLALDPVDGAVRWRSPPLGLSYASPIRLRVGDRDQIVFLSAEEVLAVSAEDGELLWRAPCRNGFANNASDPIAAPDGLLWVASQAGDGARVLRPRPSEGRWTVESLWADRDLSLHYWNALILDDTAYASIGPAGTDVAAVDLRTGEVLWREERFEKARLVAAGDRLILLDGAGTLALLEPSRRGLRILAETRLFDGESHTAPTLVGAVLFARDHREVVAIDLGRNPSPRRLNTEIERDLRRVQAVREVEAP